MLCTVSWNTEPNKKRGRWCVGLLNIYHAKWKRGGGGWCEKGVRRREGERGHGKKVDN